MFCGDGDGEIAKHVINFVKNISTRSGSLIDILFKIINLFSGAGMMVFYNILLIITRRLFTFTLFLHLWFTVNCPHPVYFVLVNLPYL